jgi:hypothetical protein
MNEVDRSALCRGALTGSIDLEQVRQARERLAALQEDIPEPPYNPPAPVLASSQTWKACALAGIVTGIIIWLFH